MGKSKEYMSWYDVLPKRKQRLLDKWEELGLTWLSGPVWDSKPHSVELEGYTDAGEDMIIYLNDVSIEALEQYVENFDINYEVSMWWENGETGRGVPFNHQGEQVEDYEQWLARIQDIIKTSKGRTRKYELTHEQELYIERFQTAAKELQAVSVGVRYNKKNDTFTFYRKR